MKNNLYAQCVLRKDNLEQVSYIPAKFANLNQVVKLKQEDGTWDEGWKVTYVGAVVNEDTIHDPYNAVKEHRKRTGDSMRKNA